MRSSRAVDRMNSEFQSSVRLLWGRGSVYSVALVLQVGSALLVLPVVTRLLGPTGYGIVAVAVLVFTLSRSLASAGLGAAVVRDWFVPEDGPLRARRIMVAAFGVAIVVTLAISALSFAWLPIIGGVETSAAMSLAVWMALPAAIQGVCQDALRAADRPWPFVVVSVLAGPGAQIAGVVLLATSGTASASAYISGLLAGTVVSAAVGVYYARPWRGGFPRFDETAGALRMSLPFVPHAVGWVLLGLGDRAIIDNLEGAAATGRYQLAYTVGTLGLTLLMTLSNAWSPIVFGARDEDRWPLLATTALSLLRTLAFATVILSLALPFVLRILAPPSFDIWEMTQVGGVLAFAVVPYVGYVAHTQLLTWLRRTRIFAWAALVSAGVNLALVALLVPHFGLVGAAVATLFGYAVLSALVAVRGHRSATVPWARRQWGLYSAMAAVGCTAGALLPESASGTAARVVLLAAALGAAASRVLQPALRQRRGQV